MINIKFTIKDGEEIIKEYEMEVTGYKQMNEMFQSSRRVWHEYSVFCESPLMITFADPYQNEVLNELSK